MKRILVAFTLGVLFLSACVPAGELWGRAEAGPGTPTGRPQVPTNPPDEIEPTVPPTVTPTGSANPEPQPSIYISPAVPPELRELGLTWGYPPSADRESAAIRLEIQAGGAVEPPASTTWIYAVVAPFPTIPDGVAFEDVRQAWAGELAGAFAGLPLWMDESTLTALSALWGAPAPGFVQVAGTADLLDSAWASRPAWGIVPFEALEPRWKVMTVDGQSPIRKDFDPAAYPLKASFSLQSDTIQEASLPLPPTNRDPAKMTTLVMTGVTAMVRATAYFMEKRGLLWPGEEIRDWLASADLTHISNEVPFAQDCPYPNPEYGIYRFCSKPGYIALLESVEVDIIELTGNHFQDWGSAATLFTLDLYNQKGWRYYGGGSDLAEARQALTIEHNGNRLAFIGCNPAGPAYAWATETQPGAATCDWEWLKSEVSRLRDEGTLVIVTFQHDEYYTASIPSQHIEDFRPMAEAGAIIVNGSQSHVAMGMEFYSGAFIHYGLGNLFFDQMDDISTRREFIDRHVFYDGRPISVELLTAMLEDYSRPRKMTPAERAEMLDLMFSASPWTTYP